VLTKKKLLVVLKALFVLVVFVKKQNKKNCTIRVLCILQTKIARVIAKMNGCVVKVVVVGLLCC